MKDNCIPDNLLFRKCKTCIHWKEPHDFEKHYKHIDHIDKNYMVGSCENALMYYGEHPSNSKVVQARHISYEHGEIFVQLITGEDFGCIHWEGEQRTGDEVV